MYGFLTTEVSQPCNHRIWHHQAVTPTTDPRAGPRPPARAALSRSGPVHRLPEFRHAPTGSASLRYTGRTGRPAFVSADGFRWFTSTVGEPLTRRPRPAPG